MSRPRSQATRPLPHRLPAILLVLVASLALSGAVAGCGSGSMTSPDGAGAPAGTALEAPVPMGAMHMPTADEMAAAWKARPDYVRQLPDDWQEAYKFALARPDVVQWMPCYCGCSGIPHRSNLDCFFQRREVKGNYTYEEHGSYCDICVRTANMASRMLRQGSTITQIRAAVDAEFGNGAVPGTDTPLPPAG